MNTLQKVYLLFIILCQTKQDFQCIDMDDATEVIQEYLGVKDWDSVQEMKHQINESGKHYIMSQYKDKATSYSVKINDEDEQKLLEKSILFLKANKNNMNISIPRIIECFLDEDNELTVFVQGSLFQTFGKTFSEFNESLHNMSTQEHGQLFLQFLKAKNEFGKQNIDQVRIEKNFVVFDEIYQPDDTEEQLKKYKKDKKLQERLRKKLERKHQQESKLYKTHLVFDPFFDIVSLPTQQTDDIQLFAPELYDSDVIDQKTTFYSYFVYTLLLQQMKPTQKFNIITADFRKSDKTEYLNELVLQCKKGFNDLYTFEKPNFLKRAWKFIKSIFSKSTSTIYSFSELCEHLAFDKEKRKSNDYYVNALENCYEYAIDKDPHEQNQTEFDESEDIKIV